MSEAPGALVVATDLPFPPRSGNHLRYLQNIWILDRLGYDVSVVAGVVRTDAASATVGPVGRADTLVAVEAERAARIDQLIRMGDLARSLVPNANADPWSHRYRRAGLDRAIVEAAERLSPQVVLLRSLFGHLAPALRSVSDHVVLDAHDSSALYATALEAHARGLKRRGLVLRRRASEVADRTLTGVDEVWVPSQREARYFEEVASGIPAILVRNGVEVPEAIRWRPGGRELLLVGSYGQPMNLAAADALVEGVLTRLCDRCPQASATLIGRDLPADRAQRWRGLPVRLAGEVADIEPFLLRAAAFMFLAPATAATGTPLKISEALAIGVPVVTSSVIAAGLGLGPSEEISIADDDDAAADAAHRLLTDPGWATSLSTAGHAFATRELSRSAVLKSVRRSSVLRQSG